MEAAASTIQPFSCLASLAARSRQKDGRRILPGGDVIEDGEFFEDYWKNEEEPQDAEGARRNEKDEDVIRISGFAKRGMKGGGLGSIDEDEGTWEKGGIL